MENFENNEEYKFEEEQRKLRAESMMDEASHHRFVMGKEDPIDEMDMVQMAEKRLNTIAEENAEFREYYEGLKSIDRSIDIIGENEEIIKGLEDQIKRMQMVASNQKSAGEQFEIDKKLVEYKKVIKELRDISEEHMRNIERFANADRPDSMSTNIGKNPEDNAWKN